MNDRETRQLLIRVFLALRARGPDLGLGQLFAAIDAVEANRGATSAEERKRLLRMLWCSSAAEAYEMDIAWAAVFAAEEPDRADVQGRQEPGRPGEDEAQSRQRRDEETAQRQQPEPLRFAEANADLATLPVRAPNLETSSRSRDELVAYWPVSRRAMGYLWRYLRRPMADGPPTVLDVRATVDRAARQGFFLAPVYRREERNHARLVLFVDQMGSMMPFHRFTRDIVETAQTEGGIGQADVFYFQNVVADDVYSDPHLTQRIPLERALGLCDADTSVLIVSDAGAARGYRRMPRIQATAQFLLRLKRHTLLIAWLNPMPRERWVSASAEIISHLIPMFALDHNDFSRAIDAVRGQGK